MFEFYSERFNAAGNQIRGWLITTSYARHTLSAKLLDPQSQSPDRTNRKNEIDRKLFQSNSILRDFNTRFYNIIISNASHFTLPPTKYNIIKHHSSLLFHSISSVSVTLSHCRWHTMPFSYINLTPMPRGEFYLKKKRLKFEVTLRCTELSTIR